MNYNKLKSKLKEFSNATNKEIIRKVKNSYIVYNTYKIININGEWVVSKRGEPVHMFDASANALAWCMFDYNRQFENANSLQVADTKLQRTKNNIFLQKQFANSTDDADRKAIALIRISDYIFTAEAINIEIRLLNKMTKYM